MALKLAAIRSAIHLPCFMYVLQTTLPICVSGYETREESVVTSEEAQHCFVDGCP